MKPQTPTPPFVMMKMKSLFVVLLVCFGTSCLAAPLRADIVLHEFAEDTYELPPGLRAPDGRGIWSVEDGVLRGARGSGSSDTLLLEDRAATVSGEGKEFTISVDAASLSDSSSHFAGLAFHVQPNGDCYILRFTARGLIQLVRRTGGESRLVGTSTSAARLEVGRMYRLSIHSAEPGVFDWSVRSDGVQPLEGRVLDEEIPLEGGLGGMWTNAPAPNGAPLMAFNGFRFATGEGEPDTRPLPSHLAGIETMAERIQRAAGQESEQPGWVSGWILTWLRDPTTTQVIDWHQAGQDAASALPFSWRKVGDPVWQEARPDRSFPFPFFSRYVHRLELTGLNPGTLYEFRIGQMEPLRFRTLPETLDRPVRLAVGGDMMGDPVVYGEINKRVAEADMDFIVWGGDLAYADGRPQNVGRWFQYIDIFSQTLLTEDRRVLPIVVGIGNHEVNGGFYWNTEFGENGWPGTDAAREKVAPFFYGLWAFPGHPGYGVLDLGTYASLIILDTDHTNAVEGEQTKWLAQVLQSRAGTTHLLPIYHVPAYPSVRPFAGRTSAAIRQHWVPLFEAAGVRMAFEHHDHAYKRTHPLRGGEVREDGIVYVGDGAWGVGLRVPAPDRDYMAKTAEKHHALLISLHPNRLEMAAMDPAGQIFDQLEIDLPQ